MKKHIIQAIKLFFFVAVSSRVFVRMHSSAEMFLFILLCYGIFFYVLFRKEMNPPNWKTYLHKEKELQGPSEKQQEIYEKAGLTESDVAFFREKMNRAKGQIQQIGTPEEIFKLGTKLVEKGLDVPFAEKLIEVLREKGLEVPEAYLDEEGLVEWLWTSVLTK